MIEIRNEQLGVFRSQARKDLPDKICRDLSEQGQDIRQSGKHLAIRDKNNAETTLSFLDDGLPEKLVRPSGLEYSFEHNPSGTLAAIAYPSGRRLEFDRDADEDVTGIRQPGLGEYRFSLSKLADDSTLLQSVTYPDHRQRSFEYDGAGRVTSIVEPSGACYQYLRDEEGNLTEIVDPIMRSVRLLTDDSGAPTAIDFPDQSREEYFYDESRGTATRVHRDGTQTRYVIKDGRIARIEAGSDDVTRFEYDDEGNLASTERNGQKIAFTAENGDIVEEQTSCGTITTSRDEEGKPISLETPFGENYKYGYDADGRLSSITTWNGRTVTIDHGPEDTISGIRFPNGVGIIQEYGPEVRLTRREIRSAKSDILVSQYEYDSCSRFTGASHSGRFTGVCKIRYDKDDRVVREESTDGTTYYDYDSKGNLVAVDDQFIRVGPMDEPLFFDGLQIAYDKRGNMLSLPGKHGTIKCQYAADGMLASCRAGDDLVSFRYDGLGRRIEKKVGSKIWNFGWNGHQLLWEEYRENPDAPPSRRDYLFLPGTVTPLGFRENDRCYWLVTDQRGAVEMALDDDGEVVWKATYDSFGRTSIEVETIRQPWRLPGQYEDEETGLYYNFARYFSPDIRSYLSLDPRWIEFEASHYSYCRNDPWNRADPFGGLAPLIAIGIAGLVGAAVGAITAAATGGDPFAGAVEGAVAGAGALVAVVLGASAGVVLAAGVVASAVGAFAGQMTEQARSGDGFCLKCALKGAGIAALTDLALLGLGRIPGVKRLAGAVAKRLTSITGPMSKWGRGKLDDALAAGRRRIDDLVAARAVKNSIKEAAEARARHPNGIRGEHGKEFSRMADDYQMIVLVRDGNPSSIKYQGQPGYTAKPMSCKAKTAKYGPDTGTVVDPTHPKQKAYWDAAERQAKDDAEWDKIRADREKAEESWKNFEENSLNASGSKYRVDDQGRVLLDDDKIHGDYDLHGVYDAQDKQRLDYGSGVEGVGDDELAAARRQDMNERLDPTGDTKFVQHGGQDDWVPPPGTKHAPDPPVTAYLPDGSTKQLADKREMKDFYTENGLNWPYSEPE